MTHDEILSWLRETNEDRLAALYARADRVRHDTVGDAVHLRGLIELSNFCGRQCAYCGIRLDNQQVARYRMTEEEILACAAQARDYGYGTVVMQAGEDFGITRDWMTHLVRRIKTETGRAITLSLGERPFEDLQAWREAGADRYLLRFETSDRELYRRIHPNRPGTVSDRIAILRQLQSLGYEAGSGVLIGIPGQTYANLADDILMFRTLDLDMIGMGPFIPHPETPLGRGECVRAIPPEEQVPATEHMTYKAVALTRLMCPEANIPSTTALATINKASGREYGLMRGANVVMPNLTPPEYRALYEIYPAKACVDETAAQCHGCLFARIRGIDRTPGTGPGGRIRKDAAARSSRP